MAVVALLVAPCTPGQQSSDPSLVAGSLATADGTRTYLVFTPPHPRALVIALHALDWTAEDFAHYTGFDHEATADGFLVVYPQGLHKAWNAGYCCPAFHPADVDDLSFLRSLITTYTRPGWKVFLMGFSNGAMMAYALACRLPQTITALGVVGSDGEACSRAAPLPAILHFQGTADTVTGNRAWAQVGSRWVKQGVTATTWWSQHGAEVHLVPVENGTHDWYHRDPDASALIAAFFVQHM